VPFTAFVSENRVIQLLRQSEQDVLYEDAGRFEVYSTYVSGGNPPGGSQMEMFRVRLLPGCRRDSEPHGSGVTEAITVYSGTLTLVIEEDVHTLSAGDAISFRADVTHVYENRQEVPCEISMLIHYGT
jgi:XRE family transcriptional regulator, regulator of sulfur utilization